MEKFNWEPEIEIIRLGAADIITTSGAGSLDEDELPPVVIR